MPPFRNSEARAKGGRGGGGPARLATGGLRLLRTPVYRATAAAARRAAHARPPLVHVKRACSPQSRAGRPAAQPCSPSREKPYVTEYRNRPKPAPRARTQTFRSLDARPPARPPAGETEKEKKKKTYPLTICIPWHCVAASQHSAHVLHPCYCTQRERRAVARQCRKLSYSTLSTLTVQYTTLQCAPRCSSAHGKNRYVDRREMSDAA